MQINENEFFRQAVLRICKNLDFEIALQECLRYIRNYIPADMFQLNIYDRGLGALRNIALTTLDECKKTDTIIPLDDYGREYIEKNETSGTIIVDMMKAKSLTQSMLRFKWMWPEHSVMVMHLAVKGSRPGNLMLCAKGLNRYTAEHLRLFSILNEPFTIALTNALRYDEVNRLKDVLADDLRYLHRRLARTTDELLIGEDFGLKKVIDMVRGVAPLDSPVLLLGETGVGKEVIANAIHRMSRRKEEPFIKINCGAIADSLIDSELFGHEKGAFTGAISQKRGCFERACGGTIFLDEVAELPLQAQVRMLRVLQEKKVTRVGGGDTIDVDIRIIAATHQDLEDMVTQKTFRADLRYRLNVFPITIPPLRQRKADIPALVNYFIIKKSRELQIHEPPRIAPGAIRSLNDYHWPGNVRELENVVERALILNRDGPLVFEDIVWAETGKTSGESAAIVTHLPSLDEITAHHIRHALERAAGKVHGPAGAAKLLGINPSTLRHRMRKLGVVYGRKKNEFRSYGVRE